MCKKFAQLEKLCSKSFVINGFDQAGGKELHPWDLEVFNAGVSPRTSLNAKNYGSSDFPQTAVSDPSPR